MKKKKDEIINSFRYLKISSIIKKKLGMLFLNMNDKRLGIITVNNIILSKDFRYAKIYVFFLNTISIKETISILNNLSSYIRKKLSENSNLNFIPKINFYYDKSIVVNNRIGNLLDKNENS